MKTSWQAANQDIACRWTNLGVEPRYDLSWMEETGCELGASGDDEVPDFATHSPLGSGEWFAPWNARWSLPGRLKI